MKIKSFTLYCRPEERGQPLKKKSGYRWCKCGYKVRGPNHNTGTHHMKRK